VQNLRETQNRNIAGEGQGKGGPENPTDWNRVLRIPERGGGNCFACTGFPSTVGRRGGITAPPATQEGYGKIF